MLESFESGLQNLKRANSRMIFGSFYKKSLADVLSGKGDEHDQMDGILGYKSDFFNKQIEPSRLYKFKINLANIVCGYDIQSLSNESLIKLKTEFGEIHDIQTDKDKLGSFIVQYYFQKKQFLQAFKNSGKTIDLNSCDSQHPQEATCIESNIFLSQILSSFYNIQTTLHQLGPHPFLKDKDGKIIDIVSNTVRTYDNQQEYFKTMSYKGFGISIED